MSEDDTYTGEDAYEELENERENQRREMLQDAVEEQEERLEKAEAVVEAAEEVLEDAKEAFAHEDTHFGELEDATTDDFNVDDDVREEVLSELDDDAVTVGKFEGFSNTKEKLFEEVVQRAIDQDF